MEKVSGYCLTTDKFNGDYSFTSSVLYFKKIDAAKHHALMESVGDGYLNIEWEPDGVDNESLVSVGLLGKTYYITSVIFEEDKETA